MKNWKKDSRLKNAANKGKNFFQKQSKDYLQNLLMILINTFLSRVKQQKNFHLKNAQNMIIQKHLFKFMKSTAMENFILENHCLKKENKFSLFFQQESKT